MAKFFYSMAGEGRGHATRVRVLTEHLRIEHSLTLFAPGHAYEILAPVYRGTDVRVIHIPGLEFSYNRHSKVDLVGTAWKALKFKARLHTIRQAMEAEIEREKPALAITDFEPALPLAAKRRGVPFISFDHQHFLVYADLSALPRAARLNAAFMGMVVKRFYNGQTESIVSSFYAPPTKSNGHRVTQIGVLLRKEILNAPVSLGDHLCAYFRRFAVPNVLKALASCGREVRIYGVGEKPNEGWLRFMPMDEACFIADLASSQGLVTTAGNQLLGEALYMRKPILALPEPGNWEQFINGFFLEQSGTGLSRKMELLCAQDVRHFLDRLEEFRCHIDPQRVSGNEEGLKAIKRNLSASSI